MTSFVLYRETGKDKLLTDMMRLIKAADTSGPETGERETFRGLLYSCFGEILDRGMRSGFYGNLWHCCLTEWLVNDENGFSMACERREKPEGSVTMLARRDIGIFRMLFQYDYAQLIKCFAEDDGLAAVLAYEQPHTTGGHSYNSRIRDRICTLAEALSQCRSAEEMLERLTAFYVEFGVGRFGLHKAFRVSGEEGGETKIIPIKNIQHVWLDDLVGYEDAKKKLVENTEAFVEGRVANNCLLYGDAGTGKSSCIKAIANQYFDRGLRIIELYRHQYRNIHDVIEQVKGRNYRFILYLDDLSFEEFETDYKYLKAVIEGGLEKKPENVLIYATSNRMHLVRESFSDKPSILNEDMHKNDTIQEKVSLSNRFGVLIYFGRPDPKQFQEIVNTLASRYGITMPEEELHQEAVRWEMHHGGLSGRTAQQFIDYLRGIRCLGQNS